MKSVPSDLHDRLVALQTDEELERKWRKARGRHSNQFWTQECLDRAKREAKRLSDYFAKNAE